MAPEIPLGEIAEWPSPLVQKLHGLGITTAEQVVSKSATPGGLAALARHLNVSEERMGALIGAASAHLHPDVARAMKATVHGGTMGLGALPPNFPD